MPVASDVNSLQIKHERELGCRLRLGKNENAQPQVYKECPDPVSKSPFSSHHREESSSNILSQTHSTITTKPIPSTNTLTQPAKIVSLRTLVTSAVAFMAAPAIAALTSTQIAGALKELTNKSRALQAPANSITVLSGPLIIIGQGPFPQLILGFQDIVATTSTAYAQLQGTPKITATAATMEIADAFREFVRVHQQLLNIMIGKAGLFSVVPFIGQPVAAVLRAVEAIVDTIAFALVDVVEGAAVSALASDRAALKITLDTTIKQYEGLSALQKRDGLDAKVFVA